MLRHGRFLYVQIQPIIFVQFMLRIELLYIPGRVINTVPENTVSEREVLNMITIKMNLEGTTRKELAAAIAEIIGEEAIYRRTPTYSYGIGDITITRDGSLVFPDDSDILERLAERGFTSEAAEDAQETAESPQEATAEEPDGLTVSLPKDGFTEAALENLQKLIDAKSALIQKALGADRLDITIADEKISFPWWDRIPEAEDTAASTRFLAALCRMAKEAKRVIAKEAEVESEKYAFRGLLLRLGYIGADSKADRKILLRNLSGHAAFPNKAAENKFKADQKAKREAAKAAATMEEETDNE